MNVTKDGFKNRQLHTEDYLQIVSAEQRGYAEVFAHQRIAENNDVITDFWTNNLLELILRKDNLNKAYLKVKSNKGAGGIDGMQVDELLPFLRENQAELIQKIRSGKYKPNPVRRVEIPKEEKGKVRKLGIPTVVDRVIQQAIAQELTPIFEEQFSENSFGFRPSRGQHDALKACQRNVEEGYVYVISMDLEKFFDTVNHSKLIEVLSRTIKDGRVISLIHKYLNAGVASKGFFEKTEEGVPQGGPLSPLLGNVMLNELDRELEKRGHKFVRYADDCIIFCKSKKSAYRTLENIIPYIEGKLFLKVNQSKTTVSHVSKIKYLGYAFYRYKGKCRLRVHPKSMQKMKNRLRTLTERRSGWSNEVRKDKLKSYIRGWINYFKIGSIKTLCAKMDSNIRYRLRMCIWKHWKTPQNRAKNLMKLGINKYTAWKVAYAGKRIAYVCNKGAVNVAINNRRLASFGLISMLDYYTKRCVTC